MAAAISSRVPEGFQIELMEDSRVASQYQVLWDAMSKELRWVIDLPEDTWSDLASVAGCRADELKDRAISAAHLSYHFIWRRVLEPAGQLPWSLCRGDPDANLQELGEMAVAPAEPCSNHLWHLIQLRHNPNQIRGVVDLLAQCAWSSLPAEQQHGSLSLLHRWHPEYGLEKLVSRALLHQAVRLLPSESKIEQQIGKVMKQLSKLDSANSEKVSGSHMLVKSLMHVTRGRKEAGLPGYEAPMHILGRGIISTRGAWWARMNLRAQEECWSRARKHHAARAVELNTDYTELHARLMDLRGHEKEEADKVQPVCMSAAAVCEVDLTKMQELLDRDEFCRPQRLNMLRCMLVIAPEALQLQPLPAETQVWGMQETVMPDWCGEMVKYRDFLRDSALVFTHNGEKQFWKVVYCVQSPNAYMALSRLLPSDHLATAPPLGSSSSRDIAAAAFDYAFNCNFGVMSTAADLPLLLWMSLMCSLP